MWTDRQPPRYQASAKSKAIEVSKTEPSAELLSVASGRRGWVAWQPIRLAGRVISAATSPPERYQDSKMVQRVRSAERLGRFNAGAACMDRSGMFIALCAVGWLHVCPVVEAIVGICACMEQRRMAGWMNESLMAARAALTWQQATSRHI